MITESPHGTILAPRTKVFPWPMQPRKHFDLEYLNELAASIAKHGILNDLICRPRAGGGPDEYETIGGECRWRAAEMAGLDAVPIKVRALSDGDALELALIDNMHREDLTEIEECDAFHMALEQRDESGAPRYATIEEFAVKIGTSKGYVQQRLSLRKLPASGRKAMERDELSFRVARVICGCPSSIVEEVMNHALNPQRYNVWLSGIGYPSQPLNAELTQQLIEECFVRKLSQAPFALDDEKLLPMHVNESGERIEGGACTDCRWNLANQESGAGSQESGGKSRGRPRGGDAKTTCMNPSCFGRKVEIHTVAALVKAKEEGCTILQGKEAEKVLTGSPAGTLSYSYVDLDEKVPPEERAQGVTDRKAPTWGKVVFGTAEAKVVTGRNAEGEATSEKLAGAMGVPVIVAVDGRGKVHRLVERKVAVAAAAKTESAPLLNLSAGRAGSVQEDDARQRQAKERDAARLRNEVTFAAVAEVVKAVGKESGVRNQESETAFWGWMIEIAAWHGGSDAAHFAVKRRGLEGKDQYEAVDRHAKTLVTMGERRAFAIELLIGRLVKFSGVDDTHFRALCKLYKVDLAGIEKRVKEAKKPAGKGAAKNGDAQADGEWLRTEEMTGLQLASAFRCCRGKGWKAKEYLFQGEKTWWREPRGAKKSAQTDAGKKKLRPEQRQKIVDALKKRWAAKMKKPAKPAAKAKKPKAALPKDEALSPEIQKQLAQIGEMAAAGKAVTVAGIQGALKLRGVRHAEWLIARWTKAQKTVLAKGPQI